MSEETEEFQLLCEEPDISQAIDRAVSILASLDRDIDEETDYENVVVSVNAEWLASVCESLLAYANCVDNVDTEELFEMNDLTNQLSSKTVVSSTKH
jgi:hypothetical protein